MPGTQTDMRVSIVCTILNDKEGALTLVDALLGQTRVPDEIIIVDGGSTDGTHEALERLDTPGTELRVLTVPGINIAAGRNRGIDAAHYDIIACTDAGCVPDANWLDELTRPFADSDITVVGGAYRVAPQTRLERIVGLLTMPGHLKPIDTARFNPSARSIAFRREAWRRAGGFPEWLYTAEDTLFDCKLRENGEVFAMAHDAIVRWRPRSTLSAVAKQFRGYARGEARIGRGLTTTRYWLRRYTLACFLLGAAAACAAWTSNTPAVWAGIGGAFALLAGPVHRQAWAVARTTFDPVDYPIALLLSHWVAIASTEGAWLGFRDRKRTPGRFVEPLRRWWGSAIVGDVQCWRMKRTPRIHTLVVSWHWPPANRAATGVLRNLFASATPESFRVLTRDIPEASSDPLETPPIPATRVRWRQSNDEDRGLPTWLASILATIHMVRAARRINRTWPVQRVLAVYPSRYSLLAGRLIARTLGVPLVPYMHDLFAETSISKNKLKRWFWDRVDRTTLHDAQLVIVPTDRFAHHYRMRGVRKIWILPHCAPRDVAHTRIRSTGHTLRVVYSGSVYQAHEDAIQNLINATQDLNGVEMTFLTRPNRVVPKERARWLSRTDALATIGDADVCVVALAKNTPYPIEIDGCFPSKIVDYAAAAKPILAVVPQGCFVDELVRRTGIGISAPCDDAEAIATAIDRFRDAETRNHCAEMSRKFTASLDSTIWMKRLERQLSGARWANVLSHPATCGRQSSATTVEPAPEFALGVTSS